MDRGLSAVGAAWLFLISYLSGNMLSTFLFPDKQQLYAHLGLFILYVAFAQIGLNVMPATLWMKRKKLSWKIVFKFRKVTWRTMLYSLLIYAISQIFILFVHQLTEIISSTFGRTYQVSIYPIATDITSLIVLIVAIGVIPPFCEELLFRGVLLTGFEKKGRWIAAAISSFLFALFHDNPYRLIELFFAAWVSSLIVIYAQSIWPAILVHMVTNISYVVGSYFQGGDLVKSMSSDSPEYVLLGLSGVASIPALYICWLLLHKIKRQEQPFKMAKNFNKELNYWFLPIFISVIWFLLEIFLF